MACCRPNNEGTTGKEGGGGSVPSCNLDNLVEEVDLLPLLKDTEFDVKLAETKWSEKVRNAALPNTTLTHPAPPVINVVKFY